MLQRQQLDDLLRSGKNLASKKSVEAKEAEKPSLLFADKDPIPYLINEAAYPELLRTILLDDEMLKAAHADDTPSKLRRDSLKEYALFSKFFLTWLNTPAAQECVDQFSQLFSATQAARMQKQFAEFKVPLGFFKKAFLSVIHSKVKYAEQLAQKVLSERLGSQFCDWLKQRDMLRVEIITTICQHVPPRGFIHSYDSFSEALDLLSGLRTLKDHNLLSEKNIAFVCKVPKLAPINANVILRLKDEPALLTHQKLILENPDYAGQICNSFSDLQEAGILEQNLKLVCQHHASCISEIAAAILVLHNNHLYDKLIQVITEKVESWHLKNLKPMAELLVLFEEYKIAERHRGLDNACYWHTKELKSACESLQREGILPTHQDWVLPVLKAQPNHAEWFAKSLTFLHEHQLLNEKTAQAFLQAAQRDEHLNPGEFFDTLKKFKMLNEENILALFPYSRSFVTSIWGLHEKNLFEPFRETLIIAFKKDHSTMRSCEYNLIKMQEAKIPIEEHHAPLTSKPEYLHSFASALIELHEAKMLYKDETLDKENYASILKAHENSPQQTASVACLLRQFQELDLLNEESRFEIIRHAANARNICDCMIYLDLSTHDKKLRTHFVTSLMNKHKHASAILCALRSLYNKNPKSKITQEQFDDIIKNPRNAVFYAKQFGKFEKSNRGALDFSAISKISHLAGQGMRCKASLFSRLPDVIVTKIAAMTEGNGALDEDTRIHVSKHFLGKPKV